MPVFRLEEQRNVTQHDVNQVSLMHVEFVLVQTEFLQAVYFSLTVYFSGVDVHVVNSAKHKTVNHQHYIYALVLCFIVKQYIT